MTWAICTDTAAYLPDEVALAYGIERIATQVVLHGVVRPEPDVTVEEVFAAQAAGRQVSTAAASPGEIGAAYARLAAAGAEAIISIHLDERTSATCDSARLAARDAPVPVDVVSSGTASFALALAVWEAAAAREAGASVREACELVHRVVTASGNTFCVRGLAMARRGGRLASDADAAELEDVPILAMMNGELVPIGGAATVPEAVELMASHVLAAGDGLRVGVGHALAGPIADALAERLQGEPAVHEVLRYGVGPVVAVHTGPGVAGAVFYPRSAGIRG